MIFDQKFTRYIQYLHENSYKTLNIFKNDDKSFSHNELIYDLQQPRPNLHSWEQNWQLLSQKIRFLDRSLDSCERQSRRCRKSGFPRACWLYLWRQWPEHQNRHDCTSHTDKGWIKRVPCPILHAQRMDPRHSPKTKRSKSYPKNNPREKIIRLKIRRRMVIEPLQQIIERGQIVTEQRAPRLKRLTNLGQIQLPNDPSFPENKRNHVLTLKPKPTMINYNTKYLNKNTFKIE